jgi:hypothetical protein
MTDDRSLERAARSWLETGPTEAPDRAVEAALLRIQTTPQERDWHVPRRFRLMSTTARLAAATAAIAVVAVAGAIALRPGGQTNVAGQPTPTPSSAPPSAASSVSLVLAPAPTTTRGDWQAISDVDVVGMIRPSERIQLSIDWSSGGSTWIQTDTGEAVLKSDTLSAPPNEIDLVTSTGSESIGCAAGQVGRYAWSRSADGLFLSLSAIDDACVNRQAAMSRTWVHSQSAVTDGKTGVFPFEGWVRMTLPSQRFGLSGTDGLGYLHSMDGPDRTLLAIKDPMGIDAPCGATRQPIEIPTTTAGFVSYVRGLPGFTATTKTATVGGRAAVHVTISPKGSATCVNGEIVAFHGNVPTATDAEWSLAVGQPHSLWIVDLNGHTALFVYEGAGVTPSEETSVISSFQFLIDLPTP